jgi:hypothetical protein
MSDVSPFGLLLGGEVERYFAENTDRDSKKLWVFHHIPKTAGSSLANDLGAKFKPRCNLYPGAFGEERTDIIAAKRLDPIVQKFIAIQQEGTYRFAHGHLRRSHLQLLQSSLPNVAPFTMLRDPFDRFISSYRYQQTPKSPNNTAFIRDYPTIESYIESDTGIALNARNTCCKFLAGSPGATFEEARSVLEQDYVFCGLLEAYPLSFAVITTLMGHCSKPTRHDNKTPESVPNDVADPKRYRDRIYEINAEDMKLYDFVRYKINNIEEAMWTQVNIIKNQQTQNV